MSGKPQAGGLQAISRWLREPRDRHHRIPDHRFQTTPAGVAAGVSWWESPPSDATRWRPGRRKPALPRPVYKLFDLRDDPFETTDLAAKRPEIVRRLKQAHQAWFREMEAEREFRLPRIGIGSERQNPVELSRADWRGTEADDLIVERPLGFWEVRVARPGNYEVRVLVDPQPNARRVHFQLGAARLDRPLAADSGEFRFENVKLPKGPGRLEAWLTDAEGENKTGVNYVIVRHLD